MLFCCFKSFCKYVNRKDSEIGNLSETCYRICQPSWCLEDNQAVFCIKSWQNSTIIEAQPGVKWDMMFSSTFFSRIVMAGWSVEDGCRGWGDDCMLPSSTIREASNCNDCVSVLLMMAGRPKLESFNQPGAQLGRNSNQVSFTHVSPSAVLCAEHMLNSIRLINSDRYATLVWSQQIQDVGWTTAWSSGQNQGTRKVCMHKDLICRAHDHPHPSPYRLINRRMEQLMLTSYHSE